MTETQDTLSAHPSNEVYYTRWPRLLQKTTLSIYAKHTYLVLCGYLSTKNPNRAWPAVNSLAKECGLSSSTIKRAIAELIESKLIRKKNIKCFSGQRNEYYLVTLVDPDFLTIVEAITPTPVLIEPVSKNTRSNRTSAPGLIEPVHWSPQTPESDQVEQEQTKKDLKRFNDAANCTEKEQMKKTLSSPRTAAWTQEKIKLGFSVEEIDERKRQSLKKTEKSTNPVPEGSTKTVAIESSEVSRRSLKESREVEVSAKKSKAKLKDKPEGSILWEEYRQLFVLRYDTEPIRNAKTNSVCKRLIANLGLVNALKLVAYYLSTNHAYYFQQCHDLSLCLKDVHKLSVELNSGERRFRKDATRAEQKQYVEQAAQKITDVDDPFAEPGELEQIDAYKKSILQIPSAI